MKLSFVRLSALRDLVFKRAAAETALIKIRAALARQDQGGTYLTFLASNVRRALWKYDEQVAFPPAKAEAFLDKIFGTSRVANNVASTYRRETGAKWPAPPEKHEDTFFIHGAPTKVAYTARPFPSVYLSHELLRDACWPLTPPIHRRYTLESLAAKYMRPARSLEQQVIDASHNAYMNDFSVPTSWSFEKWLAYKDRSLKVRLFLDEFNIKAQPWQHTALSIIDHLKRNNNRFASGGVVPRGAYRV